MSLGQSAVFRVHVSCLQRTSVLAKLCSVLLCLQLSMKAYLYSMIVACWISADIPVPVASPSCDCLFMFNRCDCISNQELSVYLSPLSAVDGCFLLFLSQVPGAKLKVHLTVNS